MRLTLPGELPLVLNHSLADFRQGDIVVVNLDTMVASKPIDDMKMPRGCVPAVASEPIPVGSRGAVRCWGPVRTKIGTRV